MPKYFKIFQCKCICIPIYFEVLVGILNTLIYLSGFLLFKDSSKYVKVLQEISNFDSG